MASRMIRDRKRNTLSAAILTGVVVLAPLPAGSADPTITAIWSILLGAAALFLSFCEVRKAHLLLLACLGFVALAYAAVVVLQLQTQPSFFASAANPWWARASDVLGQPLAGSISVVRDQPLFSIGPCLVAMLSLLCSFTVSSDPDFAKRIFTAIAYSGLAYAIVGIVNFLIDPTHVFWIEKTGYRDSLTATFVNRNTAAVYFGSCMIIWLLKAGTIVEAQLATSSRAPQSWRRLAVSQISRTTPPLIAAGICLFALLMTKSRAGIVLSLGASFLAVVLLFRPFIPSIRKTSTGLLALAAIGLVPVLIVVIGVRARIAMEGTGDGGRWEIYRATLQMIEDHWILGTGLGTFRWAFTEYRPASLPVWGIWDRGHSTLLEIAAEMGVPLATVVALGCLLTLVVLARGAFVRRRDRMLPIAGLAIAILGYAHSLIDFSLQIAGFAIVAFAAMGAGLAQSLRTPAPAASPGR